MKTELFIYAQTRSTTFGKKNSYKIINDDFTGKWFVEEGVLYFEIKHKKTRIEYYRVEKMVPCLFFFNRKTTEVKKRNVTDEVTNYYSEFNIKIIERVYYTCGEDNE